MRKPIIVFSLVMVLAPLPTLIPWVYDTWRSEENTILARCAWSFSGNRVYVDG